MPTLVHNGHSRVLDDERAGIFTEPRLGRSWCPHLRVVPVAMQRGPRVHAGSWDILHVNEKSVCACVRVRACVHARAGAHCHIAPCHIVR